MSRHSLRHLEATMHSFNPNATFLHATGQWLHPSPRIVKFANEMGIKFPDKLLMLPRWKHGDFSVRFAASRYHVFCMYHMKYFGQSDHPLAQKFVDLYTQDLKTKPLWSYVNASAGDGTRAVVRTNSERMARKALIHAMGALGYDSYGRRLDGKGRELRGTIRLFIAEPKTLLNSDFDRVVGYFKAMLQSQVIPRIVGTFKPGQGSQGRR